ncbi:MAG: Gfo/Idh/MocA family oxidoreductase [Candidatus Latescibacterota bacterium]|nr:Gfo/Idh/MocA family oxidoreductase [Candidatus Latescibacterota bacterium]
MTKIYRVAIIGCGNRGKAAARAYIAHPRTELVAICDVKSELCRALGDDLNVQAQYVDYHRMLVDEAPDIVVIPTATELHYSLASAVIEYGVHIDIEKPICTDLVSADDLRVKAEAKNVQLVVHHQGRCGAAMKAVIAAVKEGKIGQLRFTQSSGKGYYGGYGLMNIGTHGINASLGVSGHVRRVFSSGTVSGKFASADDILVAANGMGIVVGEDITALLEFDNGTHGVHLQHHYEQIEIDAYKVEFSGSEGRIIWRTNEAWWLPVSHYMPGGERRWEPLPLLVPPGYESDSGVDEADLSYVDEFVSALDQDRPHCCGVEEGIHVLEIILAIFESIATGFQVGLPQMDRTHPLEEWLKRAGKSYPRPTHRDYGSWLKSEDQRLGKQ